MEILEQQEVLEEEEITPISEFQESEKLYWETDTNPNIIIYDIENNEKIIPNSEDEITVTPEPINVNKKVFSRNVNNTKRRITR